STALVSTLAGVASTGFTVASTAGRVAAAVVTVPGLVGAATVDGRRFFLRAGSLVVADAAEVSVLATVVAADAFVGASLAGVGCARATVVAGAFTGSFSVVGGAVFVGVGVS